MVDFIHTVFLESMRYNSRAVVPLDETAYRALYVKRKVVLSGPHVSGPGGGAKGYFRGEPLPLPPPHGRGLKDH